MTVASVSASNHFTIEATRAREKEIDKVKRWAEIGQFMSAPLIRIFAGGAKELKDEAMWGKVTKALYKCSRYGQKLGIVMALENHGGFSADEVLRMIKEAASPWLKLTVDTGNFPDSPYESIEKTVPYASFVHAKFYEFDEKGMEKRLDYHRIIDIFKKHNYLGFLSIEFEGEGEEMTEVPRAVKALRSLGME
jgi:sugar phosphate isomerase/epimerase